MIRAMRVGFAQVDITPAIDPNAAEGFMRRKMVGAHDPLLAVACVIGEGDERIALVGIDCGVVLRSMTDSARAMIVKATGINPERVMVGASHTHQGGRVLTLFDHVGDEKYAAFVAESVTRAVQLASEATFDASIGHATGQVEGIHFNRRFKMRDGTEVTHPGKMHPDIVCPAGPVDPDVGIFLARRSDASPIGAIVHFGCHSTVTEGGNEYSADYAHYIRKHLCAKLGREVPVVFLLGACGDITQVNNLSEGKETGHDHADMMGRTLADAAYAAIQHATFEHSLRINAASQSMPIRVRSEAEANREVPKIGLSSRDPWPSIYAREKMHIDALRRAHPVVDCEVQSIRIGELGIVSSGTELFCQPSLDIKRASPFARTWVVTLGNEYLGYVPTGTAFYAGGYEPRTARSSFLAPEAAQKLVEGSLRALKTVKA
jgi:neutral ceramidase